MGCRIEEDVSFYDRDGSGMAMVDPSIQYPRQSCVCADWIILYVA
jgi:hypothetical protein